MLHVGLTGNVASGKSSVAAHFATWGAKVIDSDHIVRELQQPGSPVLAAIVEAFGSRMKRPDGHLDREKLRDRVMGDDGALARLNAIVHPAVRPRRAQLLSEARARGDAIVVSDVPLLFEVLDPSEFDLVVLVHAPEETRRQRLQEKRHLGSDEAERLLASQLDPEAKRERSDIIIENDGTLAELEFRSWEAWQTILALAARTTVDEGGRASPDPS